MNDHTIRSFKIASCSHFDVPTEKPEESEKQEEVEVVNVVEDEPTEIHEAEPEISSVENKNTAFDLADAESSSDSDTSIRNYLNSKLQRIKKNRTRQDWSPVDKSRSY